MGWLDDSRATNTLMSNYPHVSCWRDDISLGCLLVGKKGQIVWFGDKHGDCFVPLLNPMQYSCNNL